MPQNLSNYSILYLEYERSQRLELNQEHVKYGGCNSLLTPLWQTVISIWMQITVVIVTVCQDLIVIVSVRMFLLLDHQFSCYAGPCHHDKVHMEEMASTYGM
jgi:hypothetical protein